MISGEMPELTSNFPVQYAEPVIFGLYVLAQKQIHDSSLLRPQAEHQAIQSIRQQQQTEEWFERYNTRAGVEGTLSQGIRAFGLRRTRYLGAC